MKTKNKYIEANKIMLTVDTPEKAEIIKNLPHNNKERKEVEKPKFNPNVWKDKEMIEEMEMAKIICNAVNNKELKHCDIQCNVDCLGIAKELLKHYQPKLPEDSIVMTREKYLNKLIEQYEMGIKDSKMHYEYIAIPHIIQSIKENPDIDDAGIEELIKQISIEVKEQNER